MSRRKGRRFQFPGNNGESRGLIGGKLDEADYLRAENKQLQGALRNVVQRLSQEQHRGDALSQILCTLLLKTHRPDNHEETDLVDDPGSVSCELYPEDFVLAEKVCLYRASVDKIKSEDGANHTVIRLMKPSRL